MRDGRNLFTVQRRLVSRPELISRSFPQRILLMILAVPYGLITSADVPNYILMTRVGIHLAQEIGKHFDPLGINANLQLSEDGKIAYKDNFMGGTPLYKTGTVNQQEVKFSEVNYNTITAKYAGISLFCLNFIG